MTYALWIVQGLLALLFLFAGGMKLVLPLEKLTGPIRAAGLVRAVHRRGRGARRDRPDPARAPAHSAGPDPAGRRRLVIIMIGATVLTLASGDVAMALIPLVVGLLAAFVAYGRWRLAPRRGASHPSAHQAAG